MRLFALARRHRIRTIAAAALLALGGAELTVRLTLHRGLRARAFPNVYEPDSRFGYRYIPGSRSRLCIPDLCRVIQINAQGFPGAEFEREKPAGRFRIAVLSDSEGTGINTADGKSYVDYLGDRLRAESPNVEVINVSMDGRDRNTEDLALATERVTSYAPDILLLRTRVPFVSTRTQRLSYRGYVLSYSTDAPAAREIARRAVDYIEDRTVLQALYRASYLVRGMVRLYVARSRSDISRLLQIHINKRCEIVSRVMPESAQATLARLREARDALARTGTRLILVGERGEGPLAAAALASGLPVVTYDYPDGPQFYLRNNSHFTRAGHEAIARDLHGQLLPFLSFAAPGATSQVQPKP